MSKQSKHHDSKGQGVKPSHSDNSNDLMKLILVAVVTLVIGLVLGASLVVGYFTIAGPIENTTNSNNNVDLVSLKTNIESYVNQNLITDASVSAKVTDVNNLGNNLYEMEYEIYQSGQIVGAGLFYVSGKNLILAQAPVFDITKPIELPEINTQESVETQEIGELSEEEVVALGSFMNCLADKNVVIFGANWCGYTKALVSNLGGFGVVEPIYFECVGQEDYCQSVGVTGYPTVFLNGVKVNPERTISGFADLTGCVAPVVNQQTTTGSC